MQTFVTWCEFVGAWLLVAGPLRQAAIELDDEDWDRDQRAQVAANAPLPVGISAWWWLLPPVAYLLRRRRVTEQRHALLRSLGAEQVDRIMHYRGKAGAWISVSGGAFLLAIGATWALREHYAWPRGVFWALLLAGTVLSALNTVGRERRRHAIVERART